VKKAVMWLMNCALCNSFTVCKTQHSGTKLKYKKCLLETVGLLGKDVKRGWHWRWREDGKSMNIPCS